MRARKWANRQILLIINNLSFPCQKNREWGKWGMNGEKIHKKMGIPFLITSIFPKKQFCFTPNPGFLYCFRFIPSHTREHGYPPPKKKAQKLEKWNRYSPQKRSFLEDTFLFQVIRKIDDCVNHLIIRLLEESWLENLPDSKSSNYFFCIPAYLYVYIYLYILYI